MSSHQSEQALADYFLSLLSEQPEQPLDEEDVTASPEKSDQVQLVPAPAETVPNPGIAEQPPFERLPLKDPRAQPLEKLLKQAEQQVKPYDEPPELPPVLPQEWPEAQPQAEITEPEIVTEPVTYEPEIVIEPEVSTEIAEPEIETEIITEIVDEQVTETATELETQVEESAADVWQNIEVEHSFQALFFDVGGVTYAVPLTELGGIHQINQITPLFGKPKWFAGMMVERGQKLNAVDTAKWVLPDDPMETNYRYLVMLGTTSWGLCCEKLIGTERLNENDVKWRKSPGKRPWLAGLIKQRMCALLHVDELIKLLNKGLNIDGE